MRISASSSPVLEAHLVRRRPVIERFRNVVNHPALHEMFEELHDHLRNRQGRRIDVQRTLGLTQPAYGATAVTFISLAEVAKHVVVSDCFTLGQYLGMPAARPVFERRR